MNIKTMITTALASVALITVSGVSASAGEALIQGVGFWNAGTPTTPYSAVGDSFSFSFDVPDPLDANPTSEISNFVYELDGVAVTTAPTHVQFYSTSVNGLFDIFFPDAAVDLYGADIASSGAFVPSGFFPATAAVDEEMPGTGTAAVTLVVSAAPEPSAWALMIAGAGLAGLALRRRTVAAVSAQALA